MLCRPSLLTINTDRTRAVLALTLAGVAILAARTGSANCAARKSKSGNVRPITEYRRATLAFEANRGQHAAQADFLARGIGYSLWLTAGEATFALRMPDPKKAGHVRNHVLRMQLRGARTSAPAVGERKLAGVINAYIGAEPSRWRQGVPTFGAVRYAGVYPGIDVLYYGNQEKLEYDFVVAPNADPQAIELAFVGAEQARVAPDGALIIQLAGREMRWKPPVAYQDTDGRRRIISSRYVLGRGRGAKGAPQVRFAIGHYDKTRPLVIDPVLEYSTFIGGSERERGYSIAVNPQGEAFITGYTFSADFPTVSPEQAALAANSDVIVSRLDYTGSTLLYSTYFGGSAFDFGNGIAIRLSAQVYITGETSSSDFPVTAGAYDTTHNGLQDAFVAKFSPSGALVYSTFVGGTGSDEGFAIAVSDTGHSYVVGTSVDGFPTTAGAFSTTYGGGAFDAFVFKLSPNGSTLDYSTYLGGTSSDYGHGIAEVDGEAYVTGYTGSANFPTTVGAFDVTHDGATDAFVTRLDSAGASLIGSTFLGGDDAEVGEDLALGAYGHISVTGWTSSTDFPTTASAYDTTYNGNVDAFVTRLNPTLTGLTYSTFLGGIDDDRGFGIVVNVYSNTLVTGATNSSDFPVVDATQATFGGGTYDAFVTRIINNGRDINFSTYHGGSGYEHAHDIALDGCGSPYITGVASDTNFPTTAGAFDESHNGNWDAFVAKIRP